MSDDFGPDLNDEDLEADLIRHLPEHLRSLACPAGQPWTGSDPDADHGHTACYFTRLAANEIERLRDVGDRMAVELAKWGWGDLHYGPQPQERSVADLVEEWETRRHAE